MVKHPWWYLGDLLREKEMTQKQLAFLVKKKVSEINELIKGKRKITIQWDYLLSQALETPRKYWILQQLEYDYEQYQQSLEEWEKPEQERQEEKEEEWEFSDIISVQQRENTERWEEFFGEHSSQGEGEEKIPRSEKEKDDEEQYKKQIKRVFRDF